MCLERLDRRIANRGGHTRKEVKQLIRAGQVLVDQQPAVSAGQKIGPDAVVTVQGEVLSAHKHLYLMLNKPKGVLCATRDPRQSTVLDLVPRGLWRPGLFPAGRLDKNTEGFVLLTDDGIFAHQMLAPKNQIPKTYHAVLDGPLDLQAATKAFAEGLVLHSGDRCQPAALRLLEDGATPRLEVVICEGKYHQIKRMFRMYSREVIALRREKIGQLSLDPALLPGSMRKILHKELSLIL